MGFRKNQFRTFYLPLLVVGFLAQAALAQPVLLQIRPHIGDTLRMHLSQSVEMTGTTKHGGRDSTTSMTTSIEVFTRAIAQREGDLMIWVWIGHHSEYDALLRRRR